MASRVCMRQDEYTGKQPICNSVETHLRGFKFGIGIVSEIVMSYSLKLRTPVQYFFALDNSNFRHFLTIWYKLKKVLSIRLFNSIDKLSGISQATTVNIYKYLSVYQSQRYQKGGCSIQSSATALHRNDVYAKQLQMLFLSE
ncbi:hypothetical protein Tsp_03133 [Trichinella spiralis]|uniref:hypothetical protein n=1 Tax=Trichinella spiralis TaxID=6334 RepID=UPI0001EFBBD8|nr:hypothetical protein Tsp_03133 [Trichinella spiralis]